MPAFRFLALTTPVPEQSTFSNRISSSQSLDPRRCDHQYAGGLSQGLRRNHQVGQMRLSTKQTLRSDGWIVGHALINSINKEQVSMFETGVNWLLRQKQTETIVAFGANTIWHGLQHALRGFLVHERENRVLHKLLALDSMQQDRKMQSRVCAMANWLALRASERELLPLVIAAAQFLKIDGFDTFNGMEGIGQRQFVRTLPFIYTSWAKALPRAMENLESLVEAELDFVLGKMAIDREALAQRIQVGSTESSESVTNAEQQCSACKDDYVDLGTCLVQPRRISFNECRITKHKLECQCVEFVRALGVIQGLAATGSGDVDDVDVDEEFFKEADDDIQELCGEYDKLSLNEIKGDPFHDAAAMLYRAQGRKWISSYEPVELLCATRCLKREKYIGEKGPEGQDDFTPMPDTYSVYSPEHLTSTF